MMEYFGALPESEPAVRVPFEKGRASMDAYKWDEAIVHFQEAMKHAAGTELVALHDLVGRCHYVPGRWKEALGSHEESARLAEQFGDKQGKANALDNIGAIWLGRGEPDKVLEKHREALQLAREAGARPQEADALSNVGAFHFVRGEPAKALSYYEDALKIHQETGDRREQASLLCNIGLAHSMAGEKDKALEYCNQSLELAREIGAKRVEAGVLTNLPCVQPGKAEPGEMIRYYEDALKLYREMGEKRGESATLAGLGAVLMQDGKHEKAVGQYLVGLEICSALGLTDVSGPARHRHGLGRCLDALGREKFVAACARFGMAPPAAENLAKELASPRER
jgi:tetratricopeptide (TPR) repeat protein